LQKERGVIEKKSICSRSIEKTVLKSNSIEKKKIMKHDPLPNKSKRKNLKARST
jgi:hypothetical protein